MYNQPVLGDTMPNSSLIELTSNKTDQLAVPDRQPR